MSITSIYHALITFLETPLVTTCIKIALIVILASICLYLNKKLMAKATKKLIDIGQSKNISYLPFMKHGLTAVIYFVAIMAIAQSIPGVEKAAQTLLASTGVLTVVVGFASQEALANVVSGMMILTFKPFIIGDIISYTGIVGTVEEITLRHTVIRTPENKRLIVPNGSMNKDVIQNSNFIDAKVCDFVEIGIGYGSSIDKAREIMVSHVKAHKDYLDVRSDEDKENNAPEVVVRVIALGDSSVTLRAWAWAKDQGTGFAMKCDLLESIKKDFDKNGIEIPFPQVALTYVNK